MRSRVDGAAEDGTRAGSLAGVRVVEIGDAHGDYCGLVLAGLGAEVVKVEPPEGSSSRRIGPFVDDVVDPELSLFFWSYNRNKRSTVLDPSDVQDREAFGALLGEADVLIDATKRTFLPSVGLSQETLRSVYPELVIARITPFGDEGPWADYESSDLVHLALGGVLMNCGYDPEPGGTYTVPPMAPHAYHSLHVAGEQLAIAVVAALIHREESGSGQILTCAVHEAVAKCTETDLMSWVMLRQPFFRQTCRHAGPVVSGARTIVKTRDGRWVVAMSLGVRDRTNLASFLEARGVVDDRDASAAEESSPEQEGGRAVPGTTEATTKGIELIGRLIGQYDYEDVPWQEAQEAGLLWCPLRKPHENVLDEHWTERGTFGAVEHAELGRSLIYPVGKWVSTASDWQAGERAPRLGEHRPRFTASKPRLPASPKARGWERQGAPENVVSVHNKPFALAHIRVLDFTWFLASAGGTRFLAALGADCIKVEWKAHPDTRLAAQAPVGGREARRLATAPLEGVRDSDMGGQFNNKNPGKRGISLNVRHPKGLEIARELVARSDIVAEGFSPGVMDRIGLGYEVLRSLKPDIIYAQQSGMGGSGRYGRFRAVGPIAAALAGLSEMGGMPDPAPPSGWGYSYLDWLGAYSFALAMTTAIYQRDVTGAGQWIDASQTEVGIFASVLPILDWSVNKREWTRCANRSPYGDAAPQGVYPCAGVDRWIVITCDTQDQWEALVRVAGHDEWLRDSRFQTFTARLSHHDELDAAIGSWTSTRDRYAVMASLQAAGIPAGVAQTAEDRCDHDPQLASLGWLTEVTGTKIGTWPVAEVPVKMSETPPHIGGRINRGAPCYGEDNYEVYGQLLGLSQDEVDALAEEGVF